MKSVNPEQYVGAASGVDFSRYTEFCYDYGYVFRYDFMKSISLVPREAPVSRSTPD